MIPFHKLKKCFIIAEISANHGQSLKKAISMIRKAKECGVDAVKFQTYTADTITLNVKNRYFEVKHPKWGGQSLYDLYKKAYTPWRWFKKLKKITEQEGLIFFSTAFDHTAVDFLEDLDVDMHKIASFELIDLPFIQYVAKTKKPLILSTGMATLGEIKEAVQTARKAGATEIAVFKCVSSYPARFSEMNLKTIPKLRKRFNATIGLSDHTPGTAVPVAAVTLGAMMVEKHFTMSRKVKTPDSFFSLEPSEFKDMVRDIRNVESALGEETYGPTPDQKISLLLRRSLFAVQDVKKGELFTPINIKSIRPAYGLSPKRWWGVLGKRALRNIRKGTPLKESHFV